MSDSPSIFAHAGDAEPPRVLVIAELGVNHDGKPDRAMSLLSAAKDAGADAVKLQLFRPDRLLSSRAPLAEYQAGSADSAEALLAPLALDLDAMSKLRDAARSAGLAFIITPFSPDDADDLAALDIDLVKIASPDAVNTPLLRRAVALNKPLLISTGTCELEELEDAAVLLRVHEPGGALLQCVSSYPTPTEHAALGGIAALRRQYHLPVGYSDHTTSLDIGALAVAAGACVIEKHLTYDRQAAGPDHAASLEPAQLTEYVRKVRGATAVLGPIAKRLLPIERDVRRAGRQSVAAARDLPAGRVLTAEDLTTRRPGNGIPARKLQSVVGQRLTADIRAGELLGSDHLQAR